MDGLNKFLGLNHMDHCMDHGPKAIDDVLSRLKKELPILGTWYHDICFRNKTFLFDMIEIWNLQDLFDLLFLETSQNFSSFGQLHVCLNELKLCKVSQNPKSNGCWKCQLSTLRNKKVLFLKKYEVYQRYVVLSSANRCRIVSQFS